MYVFYDPRQNLYVHQRGSIPALGAPFKLPTNCRNTKSIAERCGAILGVSIPIREDAPVGHEPEIIQLASSEEVINRVSNLLDEWISKGRLRNSQVAILSPTQKEHSSLNGRSTLSNIKLVSDTTAWRDGDGVLFSTVKSFKGLEADAIVLIDVPGEFNESYFGQTDYYVACSRAKHILVVLKNG